jgi:hypothetical protein
MNRPGIRRIQEPFVLGVVLDLGVCLNLLTRDGIKLVSTAYRTLQTDFALAREPLPENKVLSSDGDLMVRNLDCAVIQMAHTLISRRGLPAYDSVRSVFWEGKALYPNAGFRSHNHIQICIRNTNCIKGYFLPRKKISAARAFVG